MHHAQLIVYGVEGRLAELLGALAHERALWLREVRHVKTCLNLLRRGAGVLVLRVGKNLDQEMILLEQVTHLFPNAKTIVVGPVDNPALAGLAWDLGAAYVLLPPQPIETIGEIVSGFLPQLPRAG
jgi:hypothetical protein